MNTLPRVTWLVGTRNRIQFEVCLPPTYMFSTIEGAFPYELSKCSLVTFFIATVREAFDYSVNVSVDHQLHCIKIPCTWKLLIPSEKKQHKSLKYKDWMKKYRFGNCNVISCDERFEQLKNKLSTNKCTCVNFSTNQGKEHLTSTYFLICLPGYSPKKRKKMYCAIINWSYYPLKLISHSIAFLPSLNLLATGRKHANQLNQMSCSA